MTSALALLTDAAATAGVIDPEESLSAASAQFMLRRFNRMIGSWGNERLIIFNTYTDSLLLVAGTESYSTTLLAHGNARQWDNAYVRMDSIDYPLSIISQQSYNAITYKPTPSIPEYLYVDSDWPESTLYFFPVPIGGLTAYISARQPLTDTLLLADDVDLPPGYEAALVDNLAVDISPSYGLNPSPALVQAALNARMVLKRNNAPLDVMQSGLPTGRGMFNIYSGYNGNGP